MRRAKASHLECFSCGHSKKKIFICLTILSRKCVMTMLHFFLNQGINDLQFTMYTLSTSFLAHYENFWQKSCNMSSHQEDLLKILSWNLGLIRTISVDFAIIWITDYMVLLCHFWPIIKIGAHLSPNYRK